MFTAKMYDVSNDEEFIGYVTIDEDVPEVVDISSEWELTDELEAAIHENLEEIVDLHNVMLADPDADDSMGVELETPDHREVSIVLTDEEDE